MLFSDPATESNEGQRFALGFMGGLGTNPSASLLVSTNSPDGAMVTVTSPVTPGLISPGQIIFTVGRGSSVAIPLPVGNDGEPDIRVNTPQDFGKGILVTSSADVSIIGFNKADASADAFLALPCKDFNSADGSSNIIEYKYFIFSTASETNFGQPFSSRILIVPCVESDVSIILTDEGSPGIRNLRLFQYQTFLFEQTRDLTGTIVSSRTPLSVFAGHQCGQVPFFSSACDHLVEQIPAHAVYGTMFFAVPFALRESGDIFRIGSVVDDNEVTVTCSRRMSISSTTVLTLTTALVINAGEYHKHRTLRRADVPNLTTANYSRDICCIETSKPAIVMQYSLGHSEDEVFGIGDPAMTLVPPVQQLSNNYTAHTIDGIFGTGQFSSFLSWAVSSEFFNPDIVGDDQNLMLNGTPYPPPSRSMLGSAEYTPIRCRNGLVCGYGAFGPIPVGETAVSYESARDSNPGVYASIYGFAQETSYAYPAGYQCEPIGRE